MFDPAINFFSSRIDPDNYCFLKIGQKFRLST